jgi:hypothetical protein
MTPKASGILVAVAAALLAGAIGVVALGYSVGGDFPWGTHIITIPAVALVGLIAGWMMRDRQAAEERARADIEAKKKP